MLKGPEQPPVSGGAPKQLIIFLHGLGTSGHDLFSLAPLVTDIFPDAYIASPNAPFKYDMAPVSGSYQWFSLRNFSLDSMNKGVITAAPHLNEYIDSLLEKTGLPISKLGVIGFSQGTMTALYTLLRRPKPCGAIVGFSGALLGVDAMSDEMRSKPPICLIHGKEDPVVPFDAMETAETALKSAGFTVESHARPGLQHGIDPEGIDAARKFLKRYLA